MLGGSFPISIHTFHTQGELAIRLASECLAPPRAPDLKGLAARVKMHATWGMSEGSNTRAGMGTWANNLDGCANSTGILANFTADLRYP